MTHHVHPQYHEISPPDELDDAKDCPCGGNCIAVKARDEADVNRLECSRCGVKRMVVTDSRSMAEAVSLWNLRIENEL